MVFDEKLSATVSLSQILDCFVEDGEPPSAIFSFMDMYKDNLSDILMFSVNSPRIFSLDFLKKCTTSDLCSLKKVLESVTSDESDCLIWQIFTCKDMSIAQKSIFLEPLNRLKDRRDHPYGGIGGNEFESIDVPLKSIDVSPFEMAQYVNGLSIDNIKRLSMSCGTVTKRSLFVHRILQSDVFCLVNPMNQYVFLKNLPPRKMWDWVHKGLKQILSLGFHPDMKRIVCEKILYRYGDISWIGGTDTRIIQDSKSFNELIMKMQIRGDEKSMDWILYKILVIKGLDFVGKCGKMGKNLLKEHLDITDLV